MPDIYLLIVILAVLLTLLTIALATFWVTRYRRSVASSVRIQNSRKAQIRFLTDTIYAIRQSLTEEDVLNTAVEKARQILNCDRVLVYGLDRDSQGVVIAESVTPGWPKALGMVINDPCFEARYMEKYESGRVRAIKNIHRSGLTPCYIEQLDKLAVKANLVAPILNEKKLYGLFVAHQCSAQRRWRTLEIELFEQIAMQVGFALDNARVYAERDRLQAQSDLEQAWTRFFVDATQHVHASLTEEDVLKAAVEEIRRVLACDRVLIYSREEDSRGLVIAESVAPGWKKALGVTIEDPCFEARYDQAYENGRVRSLDNIYEAGLTPCYLEMLEKLAVKANLVAPVLHESKLLGLLVAHQCSEPRRWTSLEIQWFTQMSAQVGFALDNAKLIGRVNQISQESEVAARERLQEKTKIQTSISTLINDSEAMRTTLAAEGQHHSDTLTAALDQVQGIADTARGLATTAQQVQLQLQSSSQMVQVGHETVNHTVDCLATLQERIISANRQVKDLGQLTQNLSQVFSQMDVLGEQVNNMTIEIGRAEHLDRASVSSFTKALRSLLTELKMTTTALAPLTQKIELNYQDVAKAMDSSTEELDNGSELVKEIRQKLNQVATINTQIRTLVDKVAQATETQAQTSASANQIILDAASFASHNSEQLAIVMDSIAQLAVDTEYVNNSSSL